MAQVVKRMREMARDAADPGDFALPWHWVQKQLDAKARHKLVLLSPRDDDYVRVAARLKAAMPTAAISSIELNYNVELYRMYFLQRQLVARQNGWDGEDAMELKGRSNERWVWHGARDPQSLAQVLESGFSIQHSNLEFAFYGSGLYFAADARLSNGFVTEAGSGQRKLILARVACGKIGDKASMLDPAVTGDSRWLDPKQNEWDRQRLWQLLRQPEHRKPPAGAQSVLGVDSRGRGGGGRQDKTELVREPAGCAPSRGAL